jgi:hypothetical protein
MRMKQKAINKEVSTSGPHGLFNNIVSLFIPASGSLPLRNATGKGWLVTYSAFATGVFSRTHLISQRARGWPAGHSERASVCMMSELRH